MPAIKRHHRLLLRISRQDDDPECRRRRGVSADRRKDLTMTNVAGFSPLVYLLSFPLYMTPPPRQTIVCWSAGGFRELTVQYIRCLENTCRAGNQQRLRSEVSSKRNVSVAQSIFSIIFSTQLDAQSVVMLSAMLNLSSIESWLPTNKIFNEKMISDFKVKKKLCL